MSSITCIHVHVSTDCHASATGWQDRRKLSAAGLSNLVRTHTGQSFNKTTDAQLLLEVENQLMQDGRNWNYDELKSSFQKYYDKGSRSGLLENREVHNFIILLIKHRALILFIW